MFYFIDYWYQRAWGSQGQCIWEPDTGSYSHPFIFLVKGIDACYENTGYIRSDSWFADVTDKWV